MTTVAELYALSKAYPIVAVALGVILFFIGLKLTKMFKWIVMGVAIIAIIAAIIMFFQV